MKTYCIVYKEYESDEEHLLDIVAVNAYEAYRKALDQVNPYAAYVMSYTTNKGDYHRFINNCWDKTY